MRAHIRSSVIACIAIAAAIAPAPVSPPAPPPVVREVRLAAAPLPGAIPLAFIRNQFEYCSVICPHVVQGVLTVPISAAQSPATFLGALASSGSLFKAIGTAAASVTGPATTAAEPIIDNDLSLVLPKAQHALNVTIVEAFNVGAAVSQPGEFVDAVQTARSRILDALNQPMGPPTTPTGARTIWQVLAVESVNVASAVLFQAGELLLLGVVQTADAAAQELARSGDPAAALAAGAAQAGEVVGDASARVVEAVDTAVTNIRTSLNDPFPSRAATITTSRAALAAAPPSRIAYNEEKKSDKDDSQNPSESRSEKKDEPREEKPANESQSESSDKPADDNDKKKSDARASDQSAAGSSSAVG